MIYDYRQKVIIKHESSFNKICNPENERKTVKADNFGHPEKLKHTIEKFLILISKQFFHLARKYSV
jgi:hypothetical protein